VNQQRQNKALHPTAYSSVPFARASLRSLRFRRRVSFIVVLQARGVSVTDTFPNQNAKQSTVEIRRTLLRLFQSQSCRSKYLRVSLSVFMFSSVSLIYRVLASPFKLLLLLVRGIKYFGCGSAVARVIIFVCCRRLIGLHEYSYMWQSSKSAKSRWLQQWHLKVPNLQHNKALHPTAYSLRFGRKLPSLRLSEAGELSRSVAARSVVESDT